MRAATARTTASSIGSSTPSGDTFARLALTVAAVDAERALAEACALLGTGCRETSAADGRHVVLEFWLPEARTDPRAVEGELARRGVTALAEATPEGDAWRDAMRAFHRPVEVANRLVVRPPWTAPLPDLLDVVIDPGMAFGTAQHGTTRTCLTMLADLPAGGSLLDAGCGSGVLAIAARRLGFDPVWAVDNDPRAVDATLANARANRVGLVVGRRTIGADRLPAADIVMANLTATVLGVLAESLPAPGPRHMILSGLRPDEADRTAGLFERHGLREVRRAEDEGWTTVRLLRS